MYNSFFCARALNWSRILFIPKDYDLIERREEKNIHFMFLMNNSVRNVCRDKLKGISVLLSFNLNLNLANDLGLTNQR